MTADLVLVHLYPELLRTYCDRGNVLVLQRRAEWRGFSVRVEEVSRGDALPVDARVVLIGGGTDRVQAIVGRDLSGRSGSLSDLVARGCSILGVCGGYQVLGRAYVPAEGPPIEGLGLLDVETVAAHGRLLGRVSGTASLWGRSFDVVGFENHGGRTTLGPGVEPLAAVPAGRGNDGFDGTEGAVAGTVIGTYLHGPVLALNPAFADLVLERALSPLTGGAPLDPLPDQVENAAHAHALHLPR
jgi:CobQ-like glutamine amidotransferase family enzyme